MYFCVSMIISVIIVVVIVLRWKKIRKNLRPPRNNLFKADIPF